MKVRDREDLWAEGCLFYKKATVTDLMHKELIVRFTGEEGVDAGAVRSEFLSLFLKEANVHLLEGEETKRVPVHDYGNIYALQILGRAIGHAIIQEGLGLPVFAPYVLSYLVSGNADAVGPTIADLPEVHGTRRLKNLLEEVYDLYVRELGVSCIYKTKSYILSFCSY